MLDIDNLLKAREVVFKLTNKTSLSVLQLLREKGDCTVTEIWCGARLSCQSHASSCLKKLKSLKVVKCRRQGKNVYYSIDEKALADKLGVLSRVVR